MGRQLQVVQVAVADAVFDRTGRRLPDVLMALQSGQGDLHGAVTSYQCRHQFNEQGLDAPIDVLVDHAAGLLASPVIRLPVREGLAGRGRPRCGPALL
jgi:hypothetical protein